jgi:hypothetical protein
MTSAAPPAIQQAGALDAESPGAAQYYCPNCRVELRQLHGRQLGCSRCARLYASLGGIWCLVSEPSFWRALWVGRLDEYRSRARLEIEHLSAAAQRQGSSERTGRRIAHLRSGLEAQLSALSEHLQVFDDGAARAPLPASFSSGPAPVLKCYENLFRDWSWGNDEAGECLRLVQRLVSADLGRLVVYGAGAARLALDVHTTYGPRWTVALDLNPFPLLVAARLVRGEEVWLPEFPVGPHSEREVVVTQALRCTSAVGSTFNLAFADLLRPPFAPGSIDTVLTSWVIDAVDVDFRETARAIGHVLRSGGTWLNIGPLRFDRNWPEAYSIEEVHEIVIESGFELTASFRERIDYFNSPHSGSARRETVFCFAARKVADVPRQSVSSVYPNWLLNPHEPIPLTANTIALRRSSILTHGVLSLVDGQRTLYGIAERLGSNWQRPPGDLLDPLRAFFARLPLE